MSYEVARLDELEALGPWIPVRRHFDIRAFGVNAWRAGEAGEEVIGEHEEKSSGDQELYLVLDGHATFVVDGDEIDAPPGTLVAVLDPATKRKATATEAGTTILAIGAKPGEPYAVHAWESNYESIQHMQKGDYDRARELLLQSHETQPEAAGPLYNLACVEALSGNADAAFDYLRDALEREAQFADYARTDPDFESIRDDPRFEELVGSAVAG